MVGAKKFWNGGKHRLMKLSETGRRPNYSMDEGTCWIAGHSFFSSQTVEYFPSTVC